MKKFIIFTFLQLAIFSIAIGQLNVKIEDTNVSTTATTVSVPVIATSTETISMSAMEFVITWDDAVLNFSNISHYGFASINSNDIGEPSETQRTDRITFSWDNFSNPIILSETTVLFTLNFEIVNSATDNTVSDIVFCSNCHSEFYNEQIQAIQANYENGQVRLDSSLPLEWIDFQAQASKQQTIQLEWLTKHEENMKVYQIERSTNQSDFEKIGQKSAVNKSAATYHFEDTEIQANTVYYYRLKMVEHDGKTSFSTIVSAQINEKATHITLSPNPAEDDCQLVFKGANGEAITIIVFNALGQKQQEWITTNVQFNLNVKDWASGLYYVHVLQDQVQEIVRLVKK